MLSLIQKFGTVVLSKLTGLLLRLLTLLSLFITVLGCISFLYGIYAEKSFYCIFGLLGTLVFTYVNKQT